MPRADSADPILSILAALGFGRTDPSQRPPSIPAVVEAIRRSKLPLATLREEEHPGLEWLFESSQYRELAAEHRQRREEYQREFRAFLEEARCADLPVLVIKSAGEFPYESSNLDLLVPEERMEEAARILTSHGFLHLRTYREPHKTLHKRFDRARPGAVFHLHHELSWVGAIFLDRRSVWERSEALAGFPGAWRLSPTHLVEQTIAHAVYEKAAVSVADLRRVLASIDSGGVDGARLRRDARELGWSGGLDLGAAALVALEQRILRSERLRRVLDAPLLPARSRDELAVSLGTWRCRRLFLRKIARSRDETILERLGTLRVFLFAKLRSALRLPPYRGILVALSGVDGSGKSYYRDRLQSFLEECDVPVKAVWARGGSTDLVIRLKRLLRRATPASSSVQAQPTGAVLRAGWQRTLWPWVVSAELLWSYIFTVMPARLWGRVVVCDRYVLDASVDLSFRLAENPDRRLCWRLLRKLAPRPRLHLLFDASADEMLRRKEMELDRHAIEERQERYRSLRGPAVERIDTERDPDLVAEEVALRVYGLLAAGIR